MLRSLNWRFWSLLLLCGALAIPGQSVQAQRFRAMGGAARFRGLTGAPAVPGAGVQKPQGYVGRYSWPGAGAATYRAGMRILPTASAFYNPGYYPSSSDAYGGYLSGTADVVNSTGQFMTSLREAQGMEEQNKQARIETRRQNYDEWLYERATRPTWEDERERQRVEDLRRARNDPPLHEILSGAALNTLLLGIQQMHTQKGMGPSVPLDTDMLKEINVTSPATAGSVGLLQYGRKLPWPLPLKAAAFETERQRLDQLFVQASKQARSGTVDADVLNGMTEAMNNIDAGIKEHIADFTPKQYSQAKSFLREIKGTINALQDPNVANYVNGKWAARGNTVGELVNDMTQNGLKFAAATAGDDNAYVALHNAMVSYYAGPELTKQWDTLTR
jgi:hypothetical protein